MAENNNKTITRREIGELLNQEFPRKSEGNAHIHYFYFQVEVTTKTGSGKPLDGKALESTDLEKLFSKRDKFEWKRIVENFGTVKKEDVFKITYMVKYCDPSKTARKVEQELGDHHIRVRDKFKVLVEDTSGRDDVDVFVVVTRCCNYHSGGVN